MGDEHRALYERLSRLSGRAFDRAYMRAMVQDHEKDVREWAAFANSGRSNEFHEWVSGKVPTLRHHLEMAREVWRDVRRAS
jgi:putative membrane protein